MKIHFTFALSVSLYELDQLILPSQDLTINFVVIQFFGLMVFLIN